MLKPNYTGLLSPKTGAVTSLEVLEGVILTLQEFGIKDIIIADGCGTVHVGTNRIFDKIGVIALAKRLSATTLDLNLCRMVSKTHQGFIELASCKVAECIYNVDLVINIPVIKTHAMTWVSAAMKNMKGVLAPTEKRRFHTINLHQAIADLQLILPKCITIVDGLIAQEGLGPAEGTPVPLDIIIAGDNMVAVDGVILEIIGMERKDVKYIDLADKMGIGSCDMDHIEVLGEDISTIKRSFRPAITDIKEFPGVEIYEEDACSGCIAALMIALGRMNSIGDLPMFKNLQVCIGRKKPIALKEYKNFFYIGNCARAIYEKESKISKKVHFIAGCAPAALEIEERIREVYGIDRSDPDFCFAP